MCFFDYAFCVSSVIPLFWFLCVVCEEMCSVVGVCMPFVVYLLVCWCVYVVVLWLAHLVVCCLWFASLFMFLFIGVCLGLLNSLFAYALV